ncbi:MAG: hypothetical protein ACRDY6_12740 [Acidimicrobiia bacterium]
MENCERRSSTPEWERALQSLIEQGRDREAVQLATRQLAPAPVRDRQGDTEDDTEDGTDAGSTEGGT